MTGGGDSAVCVWNLLPVIGVDFEMKGNPAKLEENEDVQMAENSEEHSQIDSQQSELTPEEREKFEKREQDIEKDVKLMESLFQNENAKS